MNGQPKEIWKDVPGFGYYEVSNYGRIRSFYPKMSGRTREGYRMVPNVHLMTPTESSTGYLKVVLKRQGRSFKTSVHRLVALAFIPNPKELPCVNHKDENKKNNIPSNLEWCSHKYNCNFGTRNERQKKAMINHPSMSKPVVKMNNRGEILEIYPSISEAGRSTKMSASNISGCCNGKHRSIGGYNWRYAI